MAHDILRLTIVGRSNADNDPMLAQSAHARIYPGVSVFARTDADSRTTAEALITIGNVLPFQRTRRENARGVAVDVIPAVRPAPPVARHDGLARTGMFLALSVLIHGGVFAAFNRPVAPKASVGVEAISVELVLGTEVNAGLAPKPSLSEDSQSSDAAEANSEPQAKPSEQPVIEPEKVSEPSPTAEVPQPEATKPEPIPEPQPRPQPPRPPEARQKQAAPAPKLEPRRQKKVTPSPVNSVASAASSGVGRGRSDNSANYRGMVAAHLARYKQFPPEAQRLGNQGSAVVSFRLDGSGTVTSVRLVRSIGAPSLDREAVAMVQRASPFPAPPDRRPQSFTVPVSFQISGR